MFFFNICKFSYGRINFNIYIYMTIIIFLIIFDLPVCILVLITSGGIATIQLASPASPPATNVRKGLKSFRLKL